MEEPNGFKKTKLNKVNRYRDRGAYDYDNIHRCVNASPVLHVSFIPVDQSSDPFPAVLPMIGCTGLFDKPDSDVSTERQDVYLHGYVSSRLMRSPNSDASQETEGTPVTIAATQLDGLVLALTPNHHSCNFRSAVVYGFASLVTDEKEKVWAMERITNNILPDRWGNTRIPPTKVEMQSTAILRVKVASASAKLRSGGPGEDKEDLANKDVTSRVWTGVIPAWIQYGEPIPGEHCKVENVPEYISEWVLEENDRNETYAVNAVDPN